MLRSGSLNSLTPRGARWVSAASTGFNRFVVFAWHAWAIMLLSGCSAYPSVGHPASNTASTSRPAVVGVFIDTLRKTSMGATELGTFLGPLRGRTLPGQRRTRKMCSKGPHLVKSIDSLSIGAQKLHAE